MVNEESYMIFLKRIIACISHGDYYSVKELSQLELEKMEKQIKKSKNRIEKRNDKKVRRGSVKKKPGKK